jgi:ligand-binding SRPBCC domain-containing protein
MRPGALIEYRIHLRFIPMKWLTRITIWEPPHRFVDEQLKGPYRMWLHEHTFEEDGDGTIVGDHVRYSVPFGALANRLFVRRDVERIFAYREKRLREIFGGV